MKNKMWEMEMQESCIDAEPSSARKMANPTRWREHDKSNINVTKDGKFISFLNEPIPTL